MKWTTFCERFDISNTPTIKVWTIEVRVPVNIPENNYKINKFFHENFAFLFPWKCSIQIFHWTVIVWWGLLCGVDNCIVKHYYKQYVNIFSRKYELILFHVEYNSFRVGVNVEYLCNITVGSAVLESYLLDVGHVCHLCSVFVSSPPYILV